ncbi:MAG: hypothetical protein A3F68_11665 [Acidobacteria bacterium RIFCSPLOWO2_12_FULL_54_10]|nr:MAG: hypothetical protein A3F68_11665 [Acidobacteria bacterium RIFCSPLOWO2_12_FULL_54_10]
MHKCEYFLLQYAPSALRETAVPIGIFLFDEAGKLIRHQITDDWRAVRCLDPRADMDYLAGLSAHFLQLAQECAADGQGDAFYRQLHLLEEESSGGIRIAQPRGVLTLHPESEFDQLYRQYLERPHMSVAKSSPREGSRSWVHGLLTEALQRHSLWDRFDKQVSVSEFTAPGDHFHVDFAYRPNGVRKYIHALSLDRDWNQAKLLSYTFWRIRQKAEASMTAVVAEADWGSPSTNSVSKILSEAQIAIQPLAGMDPWLEGIGREFRLV